jgi:hypothetical protein
MFNRQKKKYGKLTGLHLKWIKHSFSALLPHKKALGDSHSKTIVVHFLGWWKKIREMLTCVRETHANILFITSRFSKQVDMKFAKVEVLKNYWDIIKTELREKNMQSKINMKLMTIPSNIQQACLRGYVEKCREIYTIAVLQYIRMHPSTIEGVNHTSDE